ncbi:hypothetical protein M501DRAFT_994997 [Patellaria atrata CBS 101060]|uniref:DUF3669 domain-containing protein n=1 Tax=Patellaria atrata CBS 101060 TaxID=1346257 RepID=A0A9P4S7Y1_9PEZI|nr:hypothetical protein M501DRAFT_994997 [Patellaria atrata CBS 101060]
MTDTEKTPALGYTEKYPDHYYHEEDQDVGYHEEEPYLNYDEDDPDLDYIEEPLDDAPLEMIGAGSCGSVWSCNVPDSKWFRHVIKREDRSSNRSIVKEYLMHQRIQWPPRFHSFSVPVNYDLIGKNDDAFWKDKLERFGEDYQPCYALVSDRIPAFPRSVREEIVKRYCPPELRSTILNSRSNDACLMRAYLGRRKMPQTEEDKPKRFVGFSLRNYPLRADQMEEMGLDTEIYAYAMADALAMLHWDKGIDANDVEFVLAPPTLYTYGVPHDSDIIGKHKVWLLDFDLCQDMSMDEAGVNQAVEAFFRNDPYYPRPYTSSTDELDPLWVVFKKQFLRTSEILLRACHTNLPGLWVDKIEKTSKTIVKKRLKGEC